MFRVPLRFLSSLFFFLILSQLSRIKTRLWFSVLLICCRPRPHTGGSHISQTISQTYQRENSGNHLRSFTLLLHLYFSGQHDSPLRPPLSDPLCCSLSGGWHTLSAFFFFSCQIFHFYSRCWNTFTTGRKETVQPLQAVPGWWALKALTCLQNVPWRMWIILLFCAVFFSLISPSHSLSLTRLYQDRL